MTSVNLLHVSESKYHPQGVLWNEGIQVQHANLDITSTSRPKPQYTHRYGIFLIGKITIPKYIKLTGLRLRLCDVDTMWNWAASSTSSQQFIFCTQYACQRLSWCLCSEEISSRWSVWGLSCRAMYSWLYIDCICNVILFNSIREMRSGTNSDNVKYVSIAVGANYTDPSRFKCTAICLHPNFQLNETGGKICIFLFL
jgi:hypothetical protein